MIFLFIAFLFMIIMFMLGYIKKPNIVIKEELEERPDNVMV